MYTRHWLWITLHAVRSKTMCFICNQIKAKLNYTLRQYIYIYIYVNNIANWWYVCIKRYINYNIILYIMYTIHARHRAHTHAQQNMSMIFYMYNLVAFMKSYHGTVLHRYLLDIDTKLKKNNWQFIRSNSLHMSQSLYNICICAHFMWYLYHLCRGDTLHMMHTCAHIKEWLHFLFSTKLLDIYNLIAICTCVMQLLILYII